MKALTKVQKLKQKVEHFQQLYRSTGSPYMYDQFVKFQKQLRDFKYSTNGKQLKLS
jgi:hypothetical protein